MKTLTRNTRSRSAITSGHRKFIALILSLSIAVTGLAAAPARADDNIARALAGVALLGLLGAAIHESRRDDAPAATPPAPNYPQPGYRPPPTYYQPGYQRPHDHHYRPVTRPVPRPTPRPLPPRVTRYDLPTQCVGYFPNYSRNQTLIGEPCLQRSYRYEAELPRGCRVTFWNGKKHHSGYKPACLQSRGYRIGKK